MLNLSHTIPEDGAHRAQTFLKLVSSLIER